MTFTPSPTCFVPWTRRNPSRIKSPPPQCSAGWRRPWLWNRPCKTRTGGPGGPWWSKVETMVFYHDNSDHTCFFVQVSWFHIFHFFHIFPDFSGQFPGTSDFRVRPSSVFCARRLLRQPLPTASLRISRSWTSRPWGSRDHQLKPCEKNWKDVEIRKSPSVNPGLCMFRWGVGKGYAGIIGYKTGRSKVYIIFSHQVALGKSLAEATAEYKSGKEELWRHACRWGWTWIWCGCHMNTGFHICRFLIQPGEPHPICL